MGIKTEKNDILYNFLKIYPPHYDILSIFVALECQPLESTHP